MDNEEINRQYIRAKKKSQKIKIVLFTFDGLYSREYMH